MTDRATGAVEAVERIVNREGEADAILRAAVAVVGDRFGGCLLQFHDDGGWVDGPAAGAATTVATAGTVVPIDYDGSVVARLLVADEVGATGPALGQIAVHLSVFCLVGWDTAGEGWEP